MNIAQSSVKDYPVGWDEDVFRDVEFGHPIEHLLEELEHGIVWAHDATIAPPEKKRPRPVVRKKLVRFTGIRPRKPVWEPPPQFGAWPWDTARPYGGAVDGYWDFVNRWRSFGTLYLCSNLSTGPYYCGVYRRDEALRWLVSVNRWPSEPAPYGGCG